MKKIVLPFCFIALISIGLLSMNKFPQKFSFSETFNPEKNTTSRNSIKYSDCINLDDMSIATAEGIDMHALQQDVLFEEINLCLEKYQRSLDSTVKNLSTIDAHKFLHSEFQRCKTLISADSLSAIKVYYHKGIMRLCYESDKTLNSISVGTLAQDE